MCTGIRLIAKNGSVVYARTMEFGLDMESKILMIPRNYSLKGMAASRKTEGLTWKSKYAAIGANAFDEIEIIDGVNEAGLAGGLFYFPEYAEYQEVAQGQISDSIAPWQIMTWILTNFSSVQEVKEAIQKIKVSKTVFGPWKIVPPVHAIVHDKNGQSLVIEYIKGNLVLTDNSIGVFTNAPSFDWHITNLRNYVDLSTHNVEKVSLGNLAITPLSQGSGMLHLPGDFTSPSRFIRATALSQSVIGMDTAEKTRDVVFRVLDNFNIPLGTVREKQNGQIHYEYTQWTSLSDLQSKRYYFHTYDNRQVRMVDLMKMKLDSKDPVFISMQQEEGILELKS